MSGSGLKIKELEQIREHLRKAIKIAQKDEQVFNILSQTDDKLVDIMLEKS